MRNCDKRLCETAPKKISSHSLAQLCVPEHPECNFIDLLPFDESSLLENPSVVVVYNWSRGL
jgi:hypothetical protein